MLYGNAQMNNNERSANARMNAVQSPASISECEERRGTRALLLRACSLLGLVFVLSLAALFLSHGSPQDAQLPTQAARSVIGPGTR